jgi:hypothetical protein
LDDVTLPNIKKRTTKIEDVLQSPDLLVRKRNIYHGTNTKFDKFDFERGGGMVNFAEEPHHAWTYANDLGSGSRNQKKWGEIKVIDHDNGLEYHYDEDKKLWISTDGKESFKHHEFQEMMEEGDRYFDALPKDARVIQRQANMDKILDTYPDRRQPFHKQANKKGLEAFLDVTDASKIENKVNPHFTDYSQRIAHNIRRAAHGELHGDPGTYFGPTWWGASKHVKGTETKEALKGLTEQMKDAGFEGIKFQDDSHPTIAMFKEPDVPVSIRKRGMGVGGKLLKSLPYIGAGLTAYSALSSPDAGAAVMDAVVPGGVETLGRDEEQKALDAAYKKRTAIKQEHLNTIAGGY